MNNQKEIEKLLLLFYKGNTTSEDEIYLYRLLIDQPAGTNYTSEQLAFIAMMEYSDDFNSDSWSNEDQQFSEWLDNELVEKKTVEIPIYSYFMQWRGYVAAVIVVLVVVTSTMLFNKKASEPLALRNGQSISQEEASQEVQKSLQLLASCFEHTEQATQKTSEAFSDIQRILDKSLLSGKNNNK
jgi:hypothetical protein